MTFECVGWESVLWGVKKKNKEHIQSVIGLHIQEVRFVLATTDASLGRHTLGFNGAASWLVQFVSLHFFLYADRKFAPSTKTNSRATKLQWYATHWLLLRVCLMLSAQRNCFFFFFAFHSTHHSKHLIFTQQILTDFQPGSVLISHHALKRAMWLARKLRCISNRT